MVSVGGGSGMPIGSEDIVQWKEGSVKGDEGESWERSGWGQRNE